MQQQYNLFLGHQASRVASILALVFASACLAIDHAEDPPPSLEMAYTVLAEAMLLSSVATQWAIQNGADHFDSPTFEDLVIYFGALGNVLPETFPLPQEKAKHVADNLKQRGGRDALGNPFHLGCISAKMVSINPETLKKLSRTVADVHRFFEKYDGYHRLPELLEATRTNNLQELKKRLAHGEDPNTRMNVAGATRGLTALMLAAVKNNRQAAELLLEAGADPDLRVPPRDERTQFAWDGWNALRFGCDYRSFEVCEILLAHGAGLGPIPRTSSYGKIKYIDEKPLLPWADHRIALLLLDCGADPMDIFRGGNVPGIASASKGRCFLRLLHQYATKDGIINGQRLARYLDPGQKETHEHKDWTGALAFRQVSETLFRAGQPTLSGYKSLYEAGIKTIVNLRFPPTLPNAGDDMPSALRKALQNKYGGKSFLEGRGIRIVHLPIRPWQPDPEKIAAFLRLASQPQEGSVLVHCDFGGDRTGLMCAAYRIVVQHWSIEDARREMAEAGGAYTGLWEKELGEFFTPENMADLEERFHRPE